MKLAEKVKQIEEQYKGKLVKNLNSKMKNGCSNVYYHFEDKRDTEVCITTDEKNKVIGGSVVDYTKFETTQF